MDRILVYQALFTYICGEFARHSAVVGVYDCGQEMRSSRREGNLAFASEPAFTLGFAKEYNLVTETRVLREYRSI